MTDITPELSIDEIRQFLAPLIDISTCDRTSLTNLNRNREKMICKLNQTGRPLLLTVDNQALLLCNAQVYFDLESRRQCLLSRFKSVEDAVQIGMIDVADPKMVELQEINCRIEQLAGEVKDLNWKEEEAKRELAIARTRKAELTAALKDKKA